MDGWMDGWIGRYKRSDINGSSKGIKYFISIVK